MEDFNLSLKKFELFHTEQPLPYKIALHPLKGRILQAARDIDEGEVIFGEQVMVFGPATDSDLSPVCLICMSKINKKSEYKCPQCKWPMCSKACSDQHSAWRECQILSIESSEDTDELRCYEAILNLRCLFMKEQEPQNWAYFNTFSSHLQELALTEDWGPLVSRIKAQIRLKWKQPHISEDEIERTEAILYVNGLEHPPAGGKVQYKGGGGRGFYPITSLCSHDCVNNTFRTRVTNEKTCQRMLLTRAKFQIKAGQEITVHYSGGLKGRADRRRILNEGWFFQCMCQRCQSPEEMGSHLSTLTNCDLCKKDSNVCPVISNDGQCKEYKCQSCAKIFPASLAEWLEKDFISAIESTYNDDVEGLENILERYQDNFHPQHYLILIVKWLLINLLGRKKGYENHELSREKLEGKIQYCKGYLAAMNVIDPGISHNRGRTIWELYSAKVYQLQTDFSNQTISKATFLDGMTELESLVLQAEKCLSFSEESTFEWHIFRLCPRTLATIRETANFLQMM